MVIFHSYVKLPEGNEVMNFNKYFICSEIKPGVLFPDPGLRVNFTFGA